MQIEREIGGGGGDLKGPPLSAEKGKFLGILHIFPKKKKKF